MNETLKGFCIQKGYRGREVNAVLDGAHGMGVEVCWSGEALDGWVPMGTVEFCLPVMGEHRVDFFPGFLHSWLNRKVWKEDGGNARKGVFVKDATRWKSDFESRVFEKMEPVCLGEWWVSEVVTFVQEWRYYVAGGELVATGWYAGDDEDEPAPAVGVDWPANFSGAVDFGRLDDGRIALVEAHAPFACGWYGEHHKDYAEWLWRAWQTRDWWLTPGGLELLRTS